MVFHSNKLTWGHHGDGVAVRIIVLDARLLTCCRRHRRLGSASRQRRHHQEEEHPNEQKDAWIGLSHQKRRGGPDDGASVLAMQRTHAGNAIFRHQERNAAVATNR